MRMPHTDDLVRLTQNIPELDLKLGELGVVRSTWCEPYTAFEVEFTPAGERFRTRCLLVPEQVILEENEDVLAH